MTRAFHLRLKLHNLAIDRFLRLSLDVRGGSTCSSLVGLVIKLAALLELLLGQRPALEIIILTIHHL